MTDSLTTITSDQKDALQLVELVELVERLIAYGGMASDHALQLARSHLRNQTTKGASPEETRLIHACVNFLASNEGD